jgi:hypothetical protein
MKQLFTLLAILSLAQATFSQDEGVADSTSYVEEESNVISETFSSTRIINGHSIETLNKGVLEFRVEHRFGDIGGTAGGVQTMFGLDNSADIRIAFEYGITDKMMIGLGRSKGTGSPYKSLIDGFAKYRVLEQTKGKIPLSLAMIGTTSYTYMKASEDISQVSHFPEWQHRFAYSLQVNIARKFGERLSLALMPTMVHRNYVAADDVNTLFALGGAMRCGLTSTTAILVEYYHVFSNASFRPTNTQSLGVAFEWITFGHNFTVHLTNSKGFGETQFIPYTYEDWLKGQFRLGFCIGRKFQGE